MSEDKRKSKRYKVKEGAFAAFVGREELFNLGPIIDISLGGLCLRYISSMNGDREYSGIKIFGSNGCFVHIDSIDCHVVYDTEVPRGIGERIITRRCGVQFEHLTTRQLSMLRDFMFHFALDDADSQGPDIAL